MEFKEKAVKTFLNNMSAKIPNLSSTEFEIMKLAFSSGFNVGLAQDKSELEKEMALKLLAI